MKYMGSKRALLRNGLGEQLISSALEFDRVVDLFSGSGNVSWFIAQRTNAVPVAVDLQEYSRVLASAVVSRTRPIRPDRLVQAWLNEAERLRLQSRRWRQADALDTTSLDADVVAGCREMCESPSRIGPIWNAYGGHYFSPSQALTFDYMLKALPAEKSDRELCLAATIWAATRCAASPGHTAQPLQPNERAKRFIASAWSRSPLEAAAEALHEIAPRYAQTRGRATVGDANEFARNLTERDLAFVDPPYSAAQYSRFYHVLETLAVGSCGNVSGAGRYPPLSERPQSEYCLKTKSAAAMADLLSALASSGCHAIVTFPQYYGSNGLASDDIIDLARSNFVVEVRRVATSFSTLGGTPRRRRACDHAPSIEDRSGD